MRTLRHEVAILVLSAILCVSGAVLGQSEVQKIVIATITDDIFQVLDVDRTGCAFAYLVDKSGPAILRASRNGLVERFALAVPLVFPPDCGRVAQALDDGRLARRVIETCEPVAICDRLLLLLIRGEEANTAALNSENSYPNLG